MVSPDKIPKEEFMVATEVATLELMEKDLNHDPKAANALQTDLVDVLSKAHPPKQNVSKNERNMMQSLAKRKDLLILPADKGKTAVIMDREEYMDKIKIMLDDERVYKKLKKDPTCGHKENLVVLLTGLKTRIRCLGTSIET